jgi:hypothetical protein
MTFSYTKKLEDLVKEKFTTCRSKSINNTDLLDIQ